MKTTFLFGAGSSVAAGFPSTEEITRRVLSGHGVKKETSGSYSIDIDGVAPPDAATRFANCMVRKFHTEAERYYSAYDGRRTNYEDLYYLAKQVLNEESGEMENPAIRLFVVELRADTSLLIKVGEEIDEGVKRPYKPGVPDNFLDLIKTTCDYIADIVWKMLARDPASVGHLDTIVEACNPNQVAGIATLCHDNHLETFLKEQGCVLSDGFSEHEASVRYWNDNFPPEGKIPFIKLHGSVDWFCLQPDHGNQCDQHIGVITPDHDIYHTRTDDDDLQTPSQGRPELLIGTFNKIHQYSSGIFRDLHYHFRSTLSKASQIVICGYGFGDKGINSEIIDWYCKRRNQSTRQGPRLIIIHPDLKSIRTRARVAIQNNWDTWESERSLFFVEKRFEEISIDELKKWIFSK